MAVETLKATSIANLDTIPVAANLTGSGAPGELVDVGDFVTIPAAASVASTFRLARIPTNAKVKNVFFESEAQAAGAIDVSVYYSSSTVDGTPPGVQGLVVPTTGSQFFASAIAVTAAVAVTNVINESGNNNLSKRNQSLWQALGLTADPGGFFDIVAVVQTAVTTGLGRLGVRAQYVL
jgi:hypothetical protein